LSGGEQGTQKHLELYLARIEPSTQFFALYRDAYDHLPVAYFFLRTSRNGMLAGLVGNLLSGVPRMSEVERLRKLAAYYSRLADATSRDDMRNWLLALAAETLEKLHAFERQMSTPVINSAVQHPAQQQEQIQPKDDDPKKE
jgi:hypothetical protein